MADAPSPVLPDYGGACIASVVPALFRAVGLAPGDGELPAWVPEPVRQASQVVVLLVDGLGWDQLRERVALAPTLAGMAGGPITSVAPSTTATALTSITTGRPPAEHGVIGYRVRVGEGVGEVLNVLSWQTPSGDARDRVRPEDFMRRPVFGALAPPVLSRSEFVGSGFTEAHLRGVRLVAYRAVSSLAVEIGRLLDRDESFVYAYYDGIDRVAHAHGLGHHYEAEVVFVDRLVAELLAVLPGGAALVVTADHGQVDVGDRCVALADDVVAATELISGEARFRWLHARPGAREGLLERARAAHGEDAWVVSREEAVAAEWFGGPLSPEVAARVGDVAVVAHAPVAFLDPTDAGETVLRSRHGSLTPAEMWVPLVAERA